MTIEWKHIMNEQPELGSLIVEFYPSSDGYKYPIYSLMRVKEFDMLHTMEEYKNWLKDNEIPAPDIWWAYAKDFNFPDIGKNGRD